MRRGWTTVRTPEAEGSDRSAELATALAQTCDPEFLEQIVHAKSLLDSIGGQVFIAAYRNKYAVVNVVGDQGQVIGVARQRLEDPREPGEYETDGYVFHWDHIATALRGAPKERDTEYPRSERPEVPVPSPNWTEEELEAAEADLPEETVPEDVAPEPALVGATPDVVAEETAELNANGKSGDAFGG